MANIGSLPTPGQKPWTLNPAIAAINAESTASAAELTGRLSELSLSDKFVPPAFNVVANPVGEPNGTPTKIKSGQSVTVFGSAPLRVVDGWYSHSPAAAPNSAGYLCFNAGGIIDRFVMEAQWNPGEGGDATAIISDKQWFQPGGLFPASPHLVWIPTNGYIHFDYWTGSSIVKLGEWYIGDCRDGVVRRIELIRDPERPDTMYVTLPDGQVKVVSHPTISSLAGPWGVGELYETNGTGVTAGRIRFWATGRGKSTGSADYATPQDALKISSAVINAQRPPLKPARYFYTSSPANNSQTNALGVSVLRVAPWIVPATTTVTRIAFDVHAAGETGSKFRPVIYADDGNNLPGDLLLDGGKQAADTVGVFETTVSLTLKPGVYWVGGVVQDVTTTQPAIRIGNQWTPPVPIAMGSLPAAAGSLASYSLSGVGATPPASFGTGTPGGIYPRMIVRVD